MVINMNNVKGFKDFVGEEAQKRKVMKQLIEEQFELYGFEPAETPLIEREIFVKGENPNDEAVRDVFTLKDRGKRELALRFEFTFQLRRISKQQKLPYKRYQIGYNFRDEPIRQGRTRQFIQCDADIVGSNIKDDAELLCLGQDVFNKLGIKATIYVNNRKLLNEILVSENIEEKYREQVIRELDKLDKLTQKEVADNLKVYKAEKLLKIFTGKEETFKKYAFYKEIVELKTYCKEFGVNVEFRPYLARGFSYYNGTVFEIWTKELNVALCAGGAYLIDQTQATGISFGLEPLMLLTTIKGKGTTVQVIGNEQDNACINLARKLREEGISVNMILNKTISKALEYANTKQTPYTIIIGEKEASQKKYTLKNMTTGKETLVNEKELFKQLRH